MPKNMTLDRMDLRQILQDTIREEAPLLPMETIEREGRKGWEILVEMQLDAAMELQDQLENAELPPGGLLELVVERLLDYPGKPLPQTDPTLVDRKAVKEMLGHPVWDDEEEEVMLEPISNWIMPHEILKGEAEKWKKANTGLPEEDGTGQLFARTNTQPVKPLSEKLQALGIELASDIITHDHADFLNYARLMLAEFGEPVRPYLRSFYEAARWSPGTNTEGMSTPEEIDDLYRRNHPQRTTEPPTEETDDAEKHDARPHGPETDTARHDQGGGPAPANGDHREGGQEGMGDSGGDAAGRGDGTAGPAGERGTPPGGASRARRGEVAGLPRETAAADRPDTGRPEKAVKEMLGEPVWDEEELDPTWRWIMPL